MAVTLTDEQLAAAIGSESFPQVTARVLATAEAVVLDYAPDAPDAIHNEAVVRFAGYLYGSDYGGIRSQELGPQRIEFVTNHAAMFRNSGAAALLTRYKHRRAGAI